ncbi:DeoR/GlpR family DNA-binding transcription regulator [Phaeobacter gallaeciensis]|jgi:DeoR family glycerol-3-phosphate regulon repressor|uniref:DeoR/GlpR family DNA-binding transcription regulator n=1 Tax=Rhodobacterales TaxID=204455 RepID=UPI00237F7FC0|nr:DeoR/GlpR family DNA-binding transcription regulator [Phaeobacter gallaeciensis]MDE4191556.1 DeoR/GlpR family DNA-binding transcription regulator [Phaeobacter gallaeciensis]MDE4200019.1 DeoR/GlpR family DNA-binding transcription regulator [Phaeobacter gallaeciensis]MDE4204169.1 DeoR/GlpR family DNA-binding transcription regulator [Phaeobacter gallaeciensis]MDE4208311.1 DeoR/GlpR family DNA-binding transcription regulator [Phaeobacter gallaeciensis]MDE4216440.1 DeoR/GlpR family DNA-binding t
MDATTRQNEIIELLNTQDRVEVEDLAQRFGVSLQTVRTDLRDLSQRGALSRVHGGAVRVSSAATRAYADRRKLNAAGKLAMAAEAAELIPEDCSITLNIGTSTEQVARALSGHRGLTVISNNINIINMMMGGEARELILVGGAVRQSDGAIVGEDAVEFISRYKVDFAIIGASALDADGAIMDHDGREVSVARAILKNARTRVLVCDHSKFDRSAPVRICDVADLDVVITDAPVPDAFAEAARAAGTRIIVAGDTASQNERNEND